MSASPPLDQRIPLAHLPTPVEALDRLAAHLGKPPGTLWVKRDDLTALGGGGNKVRKLEYLCADALAQGCDTLVTGGGTQSNHVRLTAAAANRLGLACSIVVAGSRPDVPSANILLDELMGPEIVWFGGTGGLAYEAMEQAIEANVERLTGAGRRPYGMPIGGASTVGALGYVRAARELLEQVPEPGVVVVADGSGGTHAGLAVGLGARGRVMGVDVGARTDIEAAVASRIDEVGRVTGLGGPDGVWVEHGHAGPAYGSPTEEARQALLLAARLEGLILDPVYTGKAMAGLVAACRDGRISPSETVVFVHTGGMPALFAPAYATWLRQPG